MWMETFNYQFFQMDVKKSRWVLEEVFTSGPAWVRAPRAAANMCCSGLHFLKRRKEDEAKLPPPAKE